MRNRVDWTDPRLGSGVYEDMVSVLISRLHPTAQRIDGSGGDGGRDVQLPLEAGLEIFELKSFTGRLSEEHGRRRQVERSLARAALLNPVSWHLVVPINSTPGERVWFDGITAGYPFPCNWLDKDWLDGNMASFPEIARYFLEGTAEEVIEILRELNQEQAGLSRGVSDAVDRIRALTSRLNSLDPHYTFGISIQPDERVSVTIIPRYVGAERDRPILISAAFEFPDTEEGTEAARAFEETVFYGTPSEIASQYVTRMEIDAPAGAGGNFEGWTVQFGIPEGASAEGVRTMLRVIDERGAVVSQLTLVGTTRTSGQRGGIVTLVDVGGALTATLRIDTVTHEIKVRYQYATPPDALPSSLLPALRFLSELRTGRYMVVLAQGRPAGPPIELDGEPDEQLQGFLHLVRALDDIQRVTGVYFAMPQSLSDEELEDVQIARRLVAGDRLSSEWTGFTITTTAEAVRSPNARQLLEGEIENLVMADEYMLELSGEAYPLGRIHQTFPSARLAEQPQVSEDAPADAEVALRYIPGSDNRVYRTLELATPTTEPSQSPDSGELESGPSEDSHNLADAAADDA